MFYPWNIKIDNVVCDHWFTLVDVDDDDDDDATPRPTTGRLQNTTIIALQITMIYYWIPLIYGKVNYFQ